MESLSIGTLKNRLAHLRWWTEKIGKPGLLPADNSQLGIPKRRYITNQNKAKTLNNRLDDIRDEYVKMSLRLQAAFGLRRKESLLFQPDYADRSDHIVLKSSWTKGGKPRTLRITTPEQRRVLNEAHALAGTGSMIPAHKTYIQQRHRQVVERFVDFQHRHTLALNGGFFRLIRRRLRHYNRRQRRKPP